MNLLVGICHLCALTAIGVPCNITEFINVYMEGQTCWP